MLSERVDGLTARMRDPASLSVTAMSMGMLIHRQRFKGGATLLYGVRESYTVEAWEVTWMVI